MYYFVTINFCDNRASETNLLPEGAVGPTVTARLGIRTAG